MWKNTNNNEIYTRAKELLIDDVRYPASAFRSRELLKKLGIVPVRTVREDAPDDNRMFIETETFETEDNLVIRRITYTPKATRDISARAKDLKAVAIMKTKERAKAEILDALVDGKNLDTIQARIVSDIQAINSVAEDVDVQSNIDGLRAPVSR